MEEEGQLRVYELWLGNKKISFTYEEIKKDPTLEKELKQLERTKLENELAWFAPHGNAQKGYDCGFDLVSSVDWLNDTKHTICICCSPNRVGKTCHAIVKKIIKIIPCDPSWQIFQNGIKFRDWQGAKTLIVLAYDKGKLKDIVWPELQKWIPASELGEYRSIQLGGTREPAWDRHPRVQLKCGSKIIMFTYEQPASVCSGIVASEIIADETMPLSFFNELSQRGRTIEGGVNWDISYTPHKVEGRVDSGTNSFLYDIWTGHNTRGHKVLRTRISVEDVPDHIFPKSEKVKAYNELVLIPKQVGDQEAIRDGLARYYGIADQLSGLFYPEVRPDIHFVDWTYDDIKDKGWTHYRSMDYGVSNPTAVCFWAVSPAGDAFCYREYYVSGKDAVEHAPAIIEASGNERKLIKKMTDQESGMTYDYYEEVVKRQHYVRTWLDWHSFQNAGGSGRPISFFFHINGLAVCESTKLGQEARAENMRAYLKLDPQRSHMVTGKLNAPRLYISRKCIKWIHEWNRCITQTRVSGGERHNSYETKQMKNDHLIDATEYFCCAGAKYLGDHVKEPKVFEPISKSGGY